MSYLNDYLKIIPRVEAQRIQENIAENQEVLAIQNISEQEYEALLTQLTEEGQVQTQPIALDQEIIADDFNLFYSNVLLDLARLFPEQNSIEQAGVNYDQIHQAHISELEKEVEGLKRNIQTMKQRMQGDEGTVLHGYSFDPEDKTDHVETLNAATAYLFTDRDGQPLERATTQRLFHTHYLSLSKENEVNLIMDEAGQPTARIEVAYESPYTLINQNQNYTIDKTIDGNPDTFWFNVALKPDNSLDSASISPRREN